MSQQIETHFQRIESRVAADVAPIVDALRTGRQVDEQAKWNVAYLMAMIWLRGPAMRDQINRMQEEVMRKVMEVTVEAGMLEHTIDRMDMEEGRNTPQNLRDGVKQIITTGSYSVSFDNAAHLRFLDEVHGFANLFQGQYWRVYVNSTDVSFMTSDNPVAVVSPPTKGFYGPTFLERTHYFTLSPDLCIEAVHPDHLAGKKLRRSTLFPGMEQVVDQLNLTIVSQSYRYVYARDRRPLETLLQYVKAMDARRPPADPCGP